MWPHISHLGLPLQIGACKVNTAMIQADNQVDQEEDNSEQEGCACSPGVPQVFPMDPVDRRWIERSFPEKIHRLQSEIIRIYNAARHHGPLREFGSTEQVT